MLKRHTSTGFAAAVFGLIVATPVWSQNVPTDLLDASLEALLLAPVRDEGSDETPDSAR